jgi:NhaA family Na+:H+ antiporter
LILCNWLGVRSPLVFGLLGWCLWLAFLNSGVHATIAGVALAFTVPASTRIMTRDLVLQGRHLLSELERADTLTGYAPISEDEQWAIGALETACERAETPMQRFERVLHPWSVFFIMPLFALANAGVHIGTQSFSLASSLTLGILFGLVVGKPIGITVLTWLAVKTRLATLGEGVRLRHVAGAGSLAGIGFTMSIFITNLAFTHAEQIEAAKAAILVSSIVAGLAGSLVLRGARSAGPEG